MTLTDVYTIDPNILKRSLCLQSSTSKEPLIKQLCPADRVWTLWQQACKRLSTKGQLTTTLGQWLHTPSQLKRDWFAYLDSSNNILYVRTQSPTVSIIPMYNAYFCDKYGQYTHSFETTTNIGNSVPVTVRATEHGWHPVHHPLVLHIQTLPSTVQLQFKEFLPTRSSFKCPETIPSANPNHKARKHPTVQAWLASLISSLQEKWSELWKILNAAQHGAVNDPVSRTVAKREQLL